MPFIHWCNSNKLIPSHFKRYVDRHNDKQSQVWVGKSWKLSSATMHYLILAMEWWQVVESSLLHRCCAHRDSLAATFRGINFYLYSHVLLNNIHQTTNYFLSKLCFQIFLLSGQNENTKKCIKQHLSRWDWLYDLFSYVMTHSQFKLKGKTCTIGSVTRISVLFCVKKIIS